MPTATQDDKKKMVRRFDYKTGHYLPPDHEVEVLFGADLDRYLERRYRAIDSRALAHYMRDQGIVLPDVYELLGFDPETLGGMATRDVVSDNMARPWFAPAVIEGFEEGLASVSVQADDLVAQVIPVGSSTVDAYAIQDAATAEDYTLTAVAQAAEIPIAIIKVAKTGIVVEKSGRGLQLAKEALDAPVDQVRLWLNILGKRLGYSKLAMVADRAINGYLDDNSDNPTQVPTATQHVFTLTDMLLAAYTLTMLNGYTLTHVLMSPLTRITLLTSQWTTSGLPIFPNGEASFTEIIGGKMVPIPGLDDDLMEFQDSGAALAEYMREAFGTEDEYLPRQQIYGTYGSERSQVAPVTGITPARVLLDAR